MRFSEPEVDNESVKIAQRLFLRSGRALLVDLIVFMRDQRSACCSREDGIIVSVAIGDEDSIMSRFTEKIKIKRRSGGNSR